jgi:pSer/pThr/pTyr-binding forkhead associated (FHA) protein
MKVKLVIVGGKQAGMEIRVRKPKFLVGRGEECQLRPQSHLISRKHCAILVENGSAAIEDFGSTNGTFLNDERIQQRRDLHDGDRIKIGKLELEARLTDDGEGKKPAKVESAPEPAAAARKVASTASSDDDEISQWLTEDSDGPSAAAPAGKPRAVGTEVAAINDTVTGKVADDTTTSMPADHSPSKKEKPLPTKVVGQFKRPAKPMAESSRSAAEDMLKQFFPGKKV